MIDTSDRIDNTGNAQQIGTKAPYSIYVLYVLFYFITDNRPIAVTLQNAH